MHNDDDKLRFDPEDFRDYLQLLARLWLPRRLQRKMDAEDLVQDTILKAIKTSNPFRGDTSGQYKAWLRQILRNTLTDEMRRRNVPEESRNWSEQSSRMLETDLTLDRPGVVTGAILNEQLDHLAGWLGDLPNVQQDVLILKHCLGWKVAEIAEEFGRTEAAVAGLLRRGLQCLREKMGSNSDG